MDFLYLAGSLYMLAFCGIEYLMYVFMCYLFPYYEIISAVFKCICRILL